MIRKLLKYDLKAIARYLLPLYVVFLAISFVNGFIKPFDILDNASGFNLQVLISIMLIIIFYIMMFGILLGTIIIQIQRFQKNLLSDEGYLSFTLPVKTWQHVLSKLISSLMWIILSILVILFAFSIMTRVSIPGLIDALTVSFNEIGMVFGSSGYIIMPVYLILVLVQMWLTICNSITIGHHFENHKIIASFATYFIFYFITQALTIITAIIYLLITFGSFENVPMNAATIPNGGFLLGSLTILIGLIAIGHYLSLNYFLKNKLNLE